MKLCKHILLGACVMLGMFSCVNEEFPTVEKYQGSMLLNVQKVAPAVVRAVETADFPVLIYSRTTGSVVASYERADEVPDKVTLPVDVYYAYAHSPGQLEKVMDTPYYDGRDEVEILQNINTVSTVYCRMANGGITVDYTDEFKKIFADCTVTVDDGSKSAIIYHASDETDFAPATHYLLYEANTKALYVNVSATTREKGFRSTMNYTLTKKQATEQYDDDNEYFAGGDCIVIHCDPSKLETTEGSIVGITVSANVQFTESEEDFEIDVEDFISDIGGDDTSDEELSGSNAITLSLPKDMVVSDDTDPTLGNAHIAAEHGIKSIKVKIESTSADMMGALAGLVSSFPNADFVGGAEVVGNQDMVNLFGELEQTLSVPSEGDAEYTFPIGNFFVFLGILPGEHTFVLTVTDMEGNTKNGVLTLTVNES